MQWRSGGRPLANKTAIFIQCFVGEIRELKNKSVPDIRAISPPSSLRRQYPLAHLARAVAKLLKQHPTTHNGRRIINKYNKYALGIGFYFSGIWCPLDQPQNKNCLYQQQKKNKGQSTFLNLTLKEKRVKYRIVALFIKQILFYFCCWFVPNITAINQLKIMRRVGRTTKKKLQ